MPESELAKGLLRATPDPVHRMRGIISISKEQEITRNHGDLGQPEYPNKKRTNANISPISEVISK